MRMVNIVKNAINYFYNIAIDDIHQNSKMFYFDYAGFRYALLSYDKDPELVNNIYNLHLEILKQGLYIHQIILNKDGQIITFINGLPYILMRLINYGEKITFRDVLSFVGVSSGRGIDTNLKRVHWGGLWSDKIDYLEYEITQLGQKHSAIRNSFSYFVGLGETSIQLFNMFFGSEGRKIIAQESVGHDRIKVDDDTFELYNPLNLVVDYRVRDIAEYIKNKFFSGYDVWEGINYFLYSGGFTADEHLLFFIRLLYPTYYFDIYENIISGDLDENELQKIIDKVDDFQNILRNVYLYYRRFLQLPTIEWLE